MTVALRCCWCRRPFTQIGVVRHCGGKPWCDWCQPCVDAKRRADGIGSDVGG